MQKSPFADVDTLDIRDAIVERIERAPAGGIFSSVAVEAVSRNAFCLQLDLAETIFTVTITVGGTVHHLR